MSDELYVNTPDGTALPLCSMRVLADEAYDLLSCFTDIDTVIFFYILRAIEKNTNNALEFKDCSSRTDYP